MSYRVEAGSALGKYVKGDDSYRTAQQLERWREANLSSLYAGRNDGYSRLPRLTDKWIRILRYDRNVRVYLGMPLDIIPKVPAPRRPKNAKPVPPEVEAMREARREEEDAKQIAAGIRQYEQDLESRAKWEAKHEEDVKQHPEKYSAEELRFEEALIQQRKDKREHDAWIIKTITERGERI